MLVEAEAPCARRPASSRFGRASKLRVGDVVAIPSGGTWRERMAVSDADALVLPAEVDLEQADIADRVLPGA